ncbi:MAG TPA: radical SAM protein, partial [Longimicrobiales bacterium]|nr:radical SAM protein [Longimicrobiales bacterium]
YDQVPGLSLAGLPFPRRDLLRPGSYVTTHVFEATRGCVHRCEFCVVPSAWGTKPYQKPVEEVVADIRQHWARKIIFIDLNLISDRDYATRLFEALIPLRVRWFGLSTTLIARDPELLALAARSGCTGLLIGFESIVRGSLRESRKGFNSPDAYADIVARLHRHGITVMGCFTFGMEHDTPDVFLATARFAIEAGIDLPRFAIVTPFPGTALFRRLEAEGRILTRDWSLYDGQHVVFQPAQMSVEELRTGHQQAWRHAYSFRSMAKRLMRSRLQIPTWIAANLGYRYYGYRLDRFYTCDWFIGQTPASANRPPQRRGLVTLEAGSAREAS